MVRVGKLLVVVVFALTASAVGARAQSGSEPVLGSADYLPTPYAEGFGTVAPRTIFNGGVPSGRVTHISWSGWGGAVARARGTGAVYRPDGGYYPPVRVRLRARRLGFCPGEHARAYRVLEFRAPQWPGSPLGPWTRWSGSRTVCEHHDSVPALPHGHCRSVGEYDEVGTVQSIEAYRVSCARARAAARRVSARYANGGCARSWCTVTVRRLRCRIFHARRGESTPLDRFPFARVACRRGVTNVTAFLVLSP